MTAVVLATGTVRSSRPLSKRDSGEVFAQEVSLLTNVGDVLGETLKVMIWDRDRDAWSPKPGEAVSVVVEIDAGRFGLSATFQRLATEADKRSMPMGVPTLAGSDNK